MNRIPRLTRFAALIALSYTLAFSAARLAFWQLFDNPNDPLTGDDLLQALYLGLKFDLRLALLIVLPLLLLGWLRPLNPFASHTARTLWQGYLLLATLVVTAFYVSDFGHFAYLQTRLDSSALRFLANPLISMEMVWQSYPVLPWSIALLLLFAATAWWWRRMLSLCATTTHQPLRGWRKAGMVTATFFVVLFGLYGKLSAYPLRWSDAFFSTHGFVSALASNPLLYFYETYKYNGQPYDEEATRQLYPQLADWLGATQPDATRLNFSRRVEPMHRPSHPYNVVVVILESFAAYKSGLSGNPLQPTPNFAALAADGLYFRNFYTPSTGTARSVFAAITGLPDVEPVKTSSRNPKVVNQQVIMDQFTDYARYYFLGGSASWGNIRGLLASNIRGLQLHEEGSYDSPVIDVWGISDLDLFKEAHKVLQHERKPFIAVIQTSGNHRPYTIPEENEGFELKSASAEDLARYGFESEEEFNSYRFMDHSIGWFMQEVKRAGYFDNTLFAFFGDHGIAGNAGIHTHKADTQLGLGQNRVPFVIYAPALIPEGRVLDTVASEVDVMTSLASLSGQPHINTTLGRDLFNPAYDNERHAFIIRHAANTTIGVVDEEFYFQMPLQGSGKSLHRIHSDEPRQNLLDHYPQQAERLERLTRGLYESARYISNNNPHIARGEAVAAGGTNTRGEK
ncbi:MAG: LTA synthase family protein [Gammaproteobacteria bacterium]|nr:LTA synthase family protein [Gammaproteobacteria bacterium]